MKSRLKNNHIKIYSIHEQVKSVVVEQFIRSLKNKVCGWILLI